MKENDYKSGLSEFNYGKQHPSGAMGLPLAEGGKVPAYQQCLEATAIEKH